MRFYIHHSIRIKGQNAIRDGMPLSSAVSDPEALYRDLPCNYPRFFRMDILSKWAWVAAEALMNEQGKLCYEGMDRQKIAVALATSHGCMDVDKKYQQSTLSIPSPALFVYTLSNIMLGEICIRHGFKGEQACLVTDSLETSELYFWVQDLLENRGMEACLCGWVDATNNQHDVSMFWVGKDENGIIFSPAAMQQMHHNY